MKDTDNHRKCQMKWRIERKEINMKPNRSQEAREHEERDWWVKQKGNTREKHRINDRQTHYRTMQTPFPWQIYLPLSFYILRCLTSEYRSMHLWTSYLGAGDSARIVFKTFVELDTEWFSVWQLFSIGKLLQYKRERLTQCDFVLFCNQQALLLQVRQA